MTAPVTAGHDAGERAVSMPRAAGGTERPAPPTEISAAVDRLVAKARKALADYESLPRNRSTTS